MEDGEFLFNLKKRKPAGAALQVVIFPGLMTGSNLLFTNLIKSYKNFYPAGQEQTWGNDEEIGKITAGISDSKALT